MNTNLLKKHIADFIKKHKNDPSKYQEDIIERKDFINYYQSFTKDKILQMNEEEIYEYLSKLWAMLIWGNKHYVIDKIIEMLYCLFGMECPNGIIVKSYNFLATEER